MALRPPDRQLRIKPDSADGQTEHGSVDGKTLREAYLDHVLSPLALMMRVPCCIEGPSPSSGSKR